MILSEDRLSPMLLSTFYDIIASNMIYFTINNKEG